ncbi:hypothetical protein D9619_005636 [Psilocybe cf. subviscida]|uniref:Methyltransferase type 11 domain-containing protein n=1 Tax=Psilocybe cf. subviscida TaxID=2480587 RepID=A0A8H5BX38_9AGAR|nr:hypothetical protein D9619_005636 [Psilocybe cf. subviscida]
MFPQIARKSVNPSSSPSNGRPSIVLFGSVPQSHSVLSGAFHLVQAVSPLFELCDLAQWPLPFPDAYFDFIHARSLNIGMQDYPRFLLEVSRLLRPGGLLLLVEPTLFPCPPPSRNIPSPISNPTSTLRPPNPSHPGPAINTSSALQFSAASTSSLSSTGLLTYTDGRSQAASTSSQPYASSSQSRLAMPPPPTTVPRPPPPHSPAHTHQEMSGWAALWRTFRACLTAQRVDVHVPEKLAALLAGAGGAFENVTVHDGTVPVGFWPTDPHLLSAGQLQWTDYELLLPALRPLFLQHGLSPTNVDRLIQDAQHDLYHPAYPPSTRIHVAYANKRYNR